MSGQGHSQPTSAVVGFALLPKKVGRVLTPALQEVAGRAGIKLVAIDPDHPPSDGVELRAIVHKVPDHKGWEAYLRQLVSRNPGCKVLDPVDAIKVVRSRETQLQVLQQEGPIVLKARDVEGGGYSSCTAQAPKQVSIWPGISLAECEEVMAAAGLQVPVVMKVTAPEGDATAHEVVIVRSRRALEEAVGELRHPAVLQEFVTHLPVVFKVYVLGKHVHIDIRHTIAQAAEPITQLTEAPAHDAAATTSPPAAAASTAAAAFTSSSAADTPSNLPAHTRSPTTQLPAAATSISEASPLAPPNSSKTQGETQSQPPAQPPAQRPVRNPASAAPHALQYASAAALSPSEAAALLQQAVRSAAPPNARGQEGGQGGIAPEPLPRWVAEQLGARLAQVLGLTMFNFDVLVPLAQGDKDCPRLYVVDINYFPGYDKVAGWEAMMGDLLVSACGQA